MHYKLDVNTNYKETLITIQTSKITDSINELTTFIDQLTHSILVYKDNLQVEINIQSIIYLESFERKTFLYTEADMYEIDSPLYEIEKNLETFELIRINKQTIINPRYIKSVKALLNSRYELLMTSKEKLIVTRHYRKSFKELFIAGGIYHA